MVVTFLLAGSVALWFFYLMPVGDVAVWCGVVVLIEACVG